MPAGIKALETSCRWTALGEGWQREQHRAQGDTAGRWHLPAMGYVPSQGNSSDRRLEGRKKQCVVTVLLINHFVPKWGRKNRN